MKDFPLLISLSHDPALNLALEECLIEKGRSAVYLWSNEPVIVIGRNQNPIRECNLSAMKRDGVHLMRRRSGGGAVFHDRGNLNFTIISDKTEDTVERNFDYVSKVLSLFGVKAGVSGRNDLEVDGLKISGSAFFEDGDTFCHHGTLLVDVDMTCLSEYLTASKLKLESKGIDSVRSRVVNLSEIVPGLTVEEVVRAFIKVSGREPRYIDADEIETSPGIKSILERYRSWKWTYGESPEFNVKIERRFSWGIVEADFRIEDGIIEDAALFTDSLSPDGFSSLSKALQGLPFRSEDITKAIISSSLREMEKEDISLLIMKNLF